MHHQHMRVGGADIVLDDEMRGAAHRRGAQPRMPEGERRGAVQPAHEGAHGVAVIVGQPVHHGAVQVLGGGAGGELVQRLVQIHHQRVELVAILAAGAGERADPAERDLIRCLRGEGGLQRLHPRGQRIGFGHGGGDQRGQHGVQVGLQPAEQRPGAGEEQRIRPQQLGLAERGFRHFGIKPGGAQLRREAPRRACQLPRLGRGLLHQGQAQFYPVIGRQRRADQPGEEHLALAQNSDNSTFYSHDCSPAAWVA